jgi:hypothetical protein
MVLLIRDSRDVAASALDAMRKGAGGTSGLTGHCGMTRACQRETELRGKTRRRIFASKYCVIATTPGKPTKLTKDPRGWSATRT